MIRGIAPLGTTPATEHEQWLSRSPHICRALSVRPTCLQRYSKNTRTVIGLGSLVNRAEFQLGTVPQGMTFRPCCLDSSRAVFPTFWWGGIWAGSQRKCHSLSFLPTAFDSLRSSYVLSRFFSRRDRHSCIVTLRCFDSRYRYSAVYS